jgi:hypothetical protein
MCKKLLFDKQRQREFEDLRSKALQDNATQEDLAELANWLDANDPGNYDGDEVCFDLGGGKRLYIILKPTGAEDEYVDGGYCIK